MERQFCVYLATNIHHEVLSNFRPRCPSITKSLNHRIAIHPSRSTHEYIRPSCHLSRSLTITMPCNPSITKYSRILGSRGIQTLALLVDTKLPLTQFNSRSDRGQHKTKIEEVSLCVCKHLLILSCANHPFV